MHLFWIGDVIERFFDGRVDPLIDTVYPRIIGVCMGVILMSHSQIEWIRIGRDFAIPFRSAVFLGFVLDTGIRWRSLTLVTVLSCVSGVCVNVRFHNCVA